MPEAAVVSVRGRVFDVAPRPAYVPGKKCPSCGGRMRLQSNFGITGKAYVCGRCIFSETVGQ